MNDAPIRILAFAGSLRAGSYNRALLRASLERAPVGVESEVFDLIDVPLYNGDVEDEGDPDSVAGLKTGIHAADLVLIVTPEYNYGIPAVTKNAIDWASRPPRPQAWDGKAVAILGTTPGRLGTVSAQQTLRESLSALNAHVMAQPRLLVSDASTLFDESLDLTDEATMERLDKFMVAAAEWAQVFQRSQP